MKPSRIRSLLLTAVTLGLVGLGWWFLAPTQIGGSTSYMITHGISMEPELHTGDLVLIRPAGSYRVGQVVAYHSTILHTVVLHRIVGISHGRYTFRGDNNHFLDPTHPSRALLVGRMWLHIPEGGTVLEWIHTPWVAAALTGGVAMMLLLGGDQTRRRRRRHSTGQGSGGAHRRPRGAATAINRSFLGLSLGGVVLFAVLSVLAFSRPEVVRSRAAIPYTQQVVFGYHGRARPGTVYPTGTLSTGAPIYLQLVHKLTMTAAYRLSTGAPQQLRGSMRMRGTLSNSTGWSRSFWLGPIDRFVGPRATASARIELTQLEALTRRVSAQIGPGAGGGYTLGVQPVVTLAGVLGGRRLNLGFSPTLVLVIGSYQLVSGSAAPTPGSSTPTTAQQGFVRSSSGTVTTLRRARNNLFGVPVPTARWIAVAALALFTLIALITTTRELRGSGEDPAERINRRYRHLIVPVASVTTTPEHPPIEVQTIEALAQLAERSERLILHEQREGADNYLIDDQGTIYRYQALPAADGPRGEGDTPTAGPVSTATAGPSPTATAGPSPTATGADPASAATAAGPTGTAGPTPTATAASTAGPTNPTNPAVASTPPTITAIRNGTPAGGPHAFPLGEAAGSPADAPSGAASVAGRAVPGPGAGAAAADSRATPTGARRPEPRWASAPPELPWSQRPEFRVGATLGPLLALLAWWHARSRRAERRRLAELEDRYAHAPAASRRAARQAPPRAPGDRRRAERRRY